jgi:hypothetical protein
MFNEVESWVIGMFLILTIKSRESPWLPYVQVACHIPLERSRRGLQLCFRPHLNQRSAHKIMGFQSRGSPNFEHVSLWASKVVEVQILKISRFSLGSPETKYIWVLAPWLGIENTIKGKVATSPKSRPWWVLWVHVCPWFICAPKVFQLHTNQLVL